MVNRSNVDNAKQRDQDTQDEVYLPSREQHHTYVQMLISFDLDVGSRMNFL